MASIFQSITFLLLSAHLTCSIFAGAEEGKCLPQLWEKLTRPFQRSRERRFSPRDQKFILNGSIYIPLIGDVHGELDRFLSLISQLQIEYKVKFPIIFQLGDLGINQDPVRYTRWHQKNGTEINEFSLGDNRIFNKYFGTSSELDRIEGNIFVVRGNHDFYLDEFLYASKASSFANHFFILPDGVMQELELISNERIFVGAVGGINETDSFGREIGSRMAQAESQFRTRASNGEPGTPPNAKLNSSFKLPQSTILLTHQGPTFEVKGHSWIENLILTLQPQFHFHGHSHYALNRTTRLGSTRTIAVGNLPPMGEICTKSQCVAMLRYDLKTRKTHLVSPQLENTD
ncbi:MAG: metallophosphoesterase [Bdellovibrionales bacterium]|nr:metallophosphoesterase [Bdellovibrionales bacterium]